jgi:hypothetical protein
MSAVPVQIENCSFEPKSEQNPHPYHVNGVCGECTKCGRTHSAPFDPADGGPVTRRKEAVRRVLLALAEGCPHPLPWGVAPRHEDRGIPRGLAVWALAKTTGDRQAVAVDPKGKLIGAWGGVHPEAVVLVVPEASTYDAAADDFVAELKRRGYAKARLGKPEVKAVAS